MARREWKKPVKRELREEVPPMWSTGLVFATLILLTALMFLLTKKIFVGPTPQVEAVTEIHAQR